MILLSSTPVFDSKLILDNIIQFAGISLLWLIAIVIAYGYIKNILKLIDELKSQKYTINTGIRAVGIFFPVIGVIMGFV
jgi:hypothetical protein